MTETEVVTLLDFILTLLTPLLTTTSLTEAARAAKHAIAAYNATAADSTAHRRPDRQLSPLPRLITWPCPPLPRRRSR